MTDHDLLREYARDGSEAAFAELVRRHAGWVRAAAARQVRDAHLAEDVAQATFIVLARQGRWLGEKTPVGPWLFGVLRLVARAAARGERRRRRHEQLAAEEAMTRAGRSRGGHEQPEEGLTAGEWARVAAVLDESVARLRPADRDAVVLRFYERKSFAEVGAALGGVSEEAARKRVDRAVERLRQRLSGRGLEASLGALVPALWANTTPGVAGTIPSLNIAAAAGRPLQLAKGAMKMAAYSALKVAGACAAAAAVVVGVAIANQAGSSGRGAATAGPVTAPVTMPAAVSATPMALPVPGPPAASAGAVTATPSPAPLLAAADPQAPSKKSLLDKEVPGIRTRSPLPGDSVIELLQDMASVTITVEWEKLGTRGDKGLTLDLPPMPLRETLNAILKAAGAKKPAKMTVEGTKVLVTAAGDEKDAGNK